MMGTNYCKNITLDSCQFNTFDAHAGVYNATITNCQMTHVSIIGEGKLLVEDCVFYVNKLSKQVDVIGLRYDYGSTFMGDVYVNNVEIRYGGYKVNGNTVKQDICLFFAEWNEWDFGYKTYLPKNVYVDGITMTEIDYSVEGGVRSETVVGTNTRPLLLYPAALNSAKEDENIADETFSGGGVNINPYAPTELVVIKNCKGVEWVFPTSKQFKDMVVRYE